MTQFDSRFQEYVEAVEETLRQALPGRNAPYQRAVDAMNYSLLSGGKRIRAALLLGFCQMGREDWRPALPFAAALEMVHAYSLIHDDLPCMDDDDVRRGKPSCHIAFGEATALLAGNGLLTLAFEQMTTRAVGVFPAETVLAAAGMLARAAGIHGMLGGQVMDMGGEGQRLTLDELDAINRLKTGALFEASCAMGCLLGGGGQEEREAAVGYAKCLGRAFQIMDDILDVTADEKLLGKPVGSDAQNEKSTYPAICGLEECQKQVDALSAEAHQYLRRLPGDTAFIETLTDRLNGRNF